MAIRVFAFQLLITLACLFLVGCNSYESESIERNAQRPRSQELAESEDSPGAIRSSEDSGRTDSDKFLQLVKDGDIKAVKESIKRQPELADCRDEKGTTALEIAVLGVNSELVSLLIEGGADVNPRSAYGMSPLHRASSLGLIDVARVLIENGADVNARAAGETTPLHEAARYGKKEVVELLLENNADINARTDIGYTALGIALRSERGEVANLLRACGGVQ